MKKSNKLLLGGFLTVILLITGLHVALYAKFRNGHYLVYQPDAKKAGYDMQSYPNLTKVSIRNCSVDIQFGEELAVEKGQQRFVKYMQQGDSIVIAGVKDEYTGERNIKVVVPGNVVLSAHGSTVVFERSGHTAALNPTIILDKSEVFFSFSGKPVHLGTVKVNASGNSSAVFHSNAGVDSLDVQLINSLLDCRQNNIGQLSISADSTSDLRLQSKHLLKATITPIPNNP